MEALEDNASILSNNFLEIGRFKLAKTFFLVNAPFRSVVVHFGSEVSTTTR